MKKIQLSQGLEAIVDDEDFGRARRIKWSLNSAGYAIGHDPEQYVPGKTSSGLVLLHRYVLGLKSGDRTKVDHRNHNTLDCRKDNLRVGSQAMNMLNRARTIREGFSSKYRGVAHRQRAHASRPWVAYYGKRYLGVFQDEREAAYCRDLIALREEGLAAQLNFPVSGQEVQRV